MSASPISLRLAFRQWRARPVRPILCSLAIAASVALIFCVAVAMDSLRYTMVKAIRDILGVAEVHIRPSQHGTSAYISQQILQQVRRRPEVDFASGRLQAMAVLTHGDTRRWFDTLGVEPAYDEKLRPKVYTAGTSLPMDSAAADGGMVIDGIVAKVMGLKVGDEVTFSLNDVHPRTLRVIGIVERPTLELIAKPTVYITMESLCRDLAVIPQYIVVDVKLKDSAGIQDFDAYAKELGEQLGPAVDVAPGASSKARLEDMSRTMHILLVVLSTISALCAALIIGTTLSVGVQEHIRQFGQLRCIGASRMQLAEFLLGDALVMLAIGLSMGLLLGLLLSMAVVHVYPQFFLAYRISLASIAVAFLSGSIATLLGAAIPIWQVMRVPPMAAVTAVGRAPRPHHVWLAGAGGAMCLVLQALLWNIVPGREPRFYTYVSVGIPLIFAGWCLMAPSLLLLVENTGAVVLGKILAVRPTLLRHAWSRTPWRAGAMIAALMIGVTLFTAIRARGQSLMASWNSPAHIPDLIIKSFSGGFDGKRIARLRREHPQIGEIGLFDFFTVRMNNSVFGLGSLLSENTTNFIAVDPDAFTHMVELEFVQGNPKTALQQLKDGRHILVAREFQNVRGLGVGDKMTFRSADGKLVEFTIAGVVTSTGVELVRNYFDLRSAFNEQAVSSVLGTVADAQQYFKLDEPTLMIANASPDLGENARMTGFQERLAWEGLQSVSSVELKSALRSIIRRVMDGLSVIGIGALCVASLGVANMVIASIHARRYEFGVLRAIGAGRSQLVRLVLAEVTLVAIVAGVLGCAAGLHFAFMASRIDFLVVGFPSTFLAPDPFDVLTAMALLCGLAVLLTTLLAWLASFIPACRGAMEAQRTLLASGRA